MVVPGLLRIGLTATLFHAGTGHAQSTLPQQSGGPPEWLAPPVLASANTASGVFSYCTPAPAAQPLQLGEAVSRALCRHPLTQRSWSEIQVRAARLGQSRAAQLPTVSAMLNGAVNHTAASSTYPSAYNTGNAYAGRSRTAELMLEWVLFDFGARSAEVMKARELLASADQSFNAAVIDVMYSTARDYFGALTARASVEAARETLANATQSLRASRARLHSGVASIADELQARTAEGKAALSLTDAEAVYEEALGTLAVDMGLRPDEPIALAATSSQVPEAEGAKQPDAIRELIDEALQGNPRVLAARAAFDATRASIDAVKAQALPSVTLQAGLSASRRPAGGMGDTGSVVSASHGNYVGLRVSIPLFEGFASVYRIREAQAQSEVERAAVQETEDKVALDVWKSHQRVRAGERAARQAQALLGNAELAVEAARARYRTGVSSMVELLHVQDALTDARRQQIAAVFEWRIARLALAASVGRLDLNDAGPT
jgi:outer membrane protein